MMLARSISGVTGETVETTWRLANFLCETSNYILMPGRSYKKADLIRTLSIGQTIWMKGWRMVTESEPGTYNLYIWHLICYFTTPDRLHSNTLILSKNVDQNAIETEFLIAFYRPTGDKWQSKTLFLAIYGPRSPIVKPFSIAACPVCLLNIKSKPEQRNSNSRK